ncbi:MAG TPA: GNAT family N-acetyltransferase [Pyrinomonadaceae bacterium]|nr:GNAT family N-acetyltransferase [Pyrinomonadaceae bacterium]
MTDKLEDLSQVGARVTLRPVTPEDEDTLLKIYASTREDEMSQVTDWTTEQKEIFLRWQLQMQRRDYEARFPQADYRLILFDGEPAGRLWLGRTAEQIRLLDIAILPEFQNRKIGTYLLRKLIEESEAQGIPLRHMIYKLNTEARRFYERLGFRLIEDEHMYLLMERQPEKQGGRD